MSKHGIQITSTRVGKLEKELIRYVLDLPRSARGVDLGAGNGFISIIVSLLQKDIYHYDLKIDLKLRIFKKLFSSKRLHLIKKNLQQVEYDDFPKNIHFVYSGRFLHYLSYDDAKDILKKVAKKMKQGSKIFITVSGLRSDIGVGYNSAQRSIDQRHGFLSQSMQKRFQIEEKVTLYTQKELEKLMNQYFDTEKIWESDFKNIFFIGVKK